MALQGASSKTPTHPWRRRLRRPPACFAGCSAAAKPFDDAKVRLRAGRVAGGWPPALEGKRPRRDFSCCLRTGSRSGKRRRQGGGDRRRGTARAVRNGSPRPELARRHPSTGGRDDRRGDRRRVRRLLLLFMSLVFHGQWIVMGRQEKNNRVVEVILSSIRPRAPPRRQGDRHRPPRPLAARRCRRAAAVLLVLASSSAPSNSAATWHSSSPGSCSGSRSMLSRSPPRGALASSQQNADTAAQPVTYTLVGVYFAGYAALSANAEGLLATLLNDLPAQRAARAARSQRPRRRPALGAHRRDRARAHHHLPTRSVRRPCLRPRPPPQRPAPRAPRCLATRAPALTEGRPR